MRARILKSDAALDALLERVGWMTYKLNEPLVVILKEFPEIAVQRMGTSL